MLFRSASGRSADAIPILKQGLQKPPYDPNLVVSLAWALVDSGSDITEARHWLKIALQNDPHSPYLADTAAWMEYRGGNYQAALTALQPSLTHANEVPEIAYHAGAIHAKLGNLAQAAEFLKLSLQSPRPFNGQKEAKQLLQSLNAKREKPR